MKLTWELLKEIVKEMRIKQKRMIKKQGGTNELLVAITILHPTTLQRILFYPNSINLVTGIAWSDYKDKYLFRNIKEMLDL